MKENYDVSHYDEDAAMDARVVARTIESAKALGAEAVLFILDPHHENDFDLYGWTLRRGYRLLEHTPHGQIMIRDL